MSDLLLAQIEALRPWHYNHSHEDVHIRSDHPTSANVHDRFGKALMEGLASHLFRNPEDRRVLDLGCLEGHYTDVFCQAGYREAVGVDLSEGHVRRAKFLLKELRRHDNARIVQGNATDPAVIKPLGSFDVILFHGLLYHLKDPLRAFDVIEQAGTQDAVLLLSTQFKTGLEFVVNPMPLGQIQIKALEGRGAVETLQSPQDGSAFERCSFRLNPAALHAVLGLYGYQTIVAYDTPQDRDRSWHFGVNLVATRTRRPNLAEELNQVIRLPLVHFYDWDGRSVDSYQFDEHWEARTTLRLLENLRATVRLARHAGSPHRRLTVVRSVRDRLNEHIRARITRVVVGGKSLLGWE